MSSSKGNYLISLIWRSYENENTNMKNNGVFNVRKARVEIANENKTGYRYCFTWVIATSAKLRALAVGFHRKVIVYS